MKTKWQYSGDVNMLDYGGKNTRRIDKRQFQIMELINMDEACGWDNAGQPKYHVELRLIDLDAIPAKEIHSALSYCGQEHLDNPSDEILADCCDSYGTHAPLGNWSGNNARKLLREAYQEANRLLDSSALEEQLDRPVNKIGSSAREFMAGDITSALQRGVESGNTDARIMAKMYGAPQEVIDNTRPVDWLPYLMGYIAGLNDQPKETDPDACKEYFRGYDRGLAVKAGTCPAPDWIKTQAA